ncbi:hypothetical protein, partial [Rhodoferax sp.]|uniref:hypothetical protein n=1 Tax=Rhodoferax sp. TaxID=50421 RepID=UPI003BB72B11
RKQTFLRPVEPSVAKALGHRDDASVALLVVAGRTKKHFQSPGQKARSWKIVFRRVSSMLSTM